jgi:hypothetical protein
VPWLFIGYGYFKLRYWGPSDDAVQEARLQRAERYARALKPIGKEPSYEFCRRLTFATLIASLLFALCLPILLMDFYRVTFKYFCSSSISFASPSRKTFPSRGRSERGVTSCVAVRSA